MWGASPAQLAEVKAALGRLTPYWAVTPAAPGVANYSSEDGLTIRVRQPKPGSGFGRAQLMVSFIKPVA